MNVLMALLTWLAAITGGAVVLLSLFILLNLVLTEGIDVALPW